MRCAHAGHKLAVVPANAGTHNHRLEFVAPSAGTAFPPTTDITRYGSLRAAGRQGFTMKE